VVDPHNKTVHGNRSGEKEASVAFAQGGFALAALLTSVSSFEL
jgi:hypothetical protein